MSRLSPARLALLGALTALGSLGTQMFIPAMPAAAGDLRMSASAMQLTISIYLAGLGVGQLVWGPVSDAIGRRPVLLAGAAVFALGSLAGSLAQGPVLLLGARLVQALGGAAALIGARALVADTATPGRETSSLAALASITLISPTVAPTLGGLVVVALGWRAIFAVLALAGAIAAALLHLAYPAHATGPRVPRTGTITRDYAALLRDRTFGLFTIGNALVSTALYLFLSSSPFLLQHVHHLSAPAAGLCYGLVAGATIVGTFWVRALERVGTHVVVPVACAVMATAAILLAGVAVMGARSLVLFMTGVTIFALAGGLSGPAALGGALRAGAAARGSASSIFGATQMLVSAALSAALAPLVAPHPPRALPLAIAGVAAGAIVLLLAGWRSAARQPPSTAQADALRPTMQNRIPR